MPVKTKGKVTSLYLSTDNERWSIRDNNEKQYTIDQAKETLKSGMVKDYSLSFQRLMLWNWDIDRLLQFYREET